MFIWIVFGIMVLVQVIFNIMSVFVNMLDGVVFYVVGNFNGWDEGSLDYVFIVVVDGIYIFIFEFDLGILMFKFIWGSWVIVEGNVDGGFLFN